MKLKPVKKVLTLLLGAALMISALAGCGGSQQGASQGETQAPAAGDAAENGAADTAADAGRTIVLAESWSFPSMYPVISPETASNFGSAYWSRNFYDTLVEYDENGELTGALAEDWNVSDDGLTLTFTLREGVQFSDGTPLTADAVKQSIDASLVNLGGYIGNYGKIGALITSTEAPDDSTFVIHLSGPYYNAVHDLTYALPYAIVNPAAFEGGVENAFANCAEATMGTGPYMYASYADDVYTFVRNPYYWGEAPEVDSFQIKVIPDNESKILALQSGEVDALIGASRLTYEGYSELEAAGYGVSINDRSTRTDYLGMRVADINIWNEDYTEVVQTIPAGVFADKNVRLAASMIIDQQLLSETVFNNIDSPAETLFPAYLPLCDVAQTTYDTDPAEAARLLAESGWTDSDGDGILDKNGEKLSVTISFTNDFGTLASAMAAVKSQLEEAGFEVTLAPAADMMDWFMAAMSGNYDLIFWQTNGGAMDPSSTVSNICSMADPVLGLLGGYGSISPELIAELDTTPDNARVAEIYETLLTDISEEALVIPLTYQNDISAWNPEEIAGYTYYYDTSYTLVQNITLN